MPLPTTMLIAPPLPLVADPETREIEPELPTLDVPVLRTISPELPKDSAFAVDNAILPDPELTLEPVTITTAPPKPVPYAKPPFTVTNPALAPGSRTSPASKDMTPPTPERPEPATTLIEPARPPVAAPVVRTMLPEFPELDDPVPKYKRPDEPNEPDDAVER